MLSVNICGDSSAVLHFPIMDFLVILQKPQTWCSADNDSKQNSVSDVLCLLITLNRHYCFNLKNKVRAEERPWNGTSESKNSSMGGKWSTEQLQCCGGCDEDKEVIMGQLRIDMGSGEWETGNRRQEKVKVKGRRRGWRRVRVWYAVTCWSFHHVMVLN